MYESVVRKNMVRKNMVRKEYDDIFPVSMSKDVPCPISSSPLIASVFVPRFVLVRYMHDT